MKTLPINDHNQGIFSTKQGTFFQFLKRGRGELPPSSPLVTHLNNKKIIKSVIYRSTSQNNSEFNSFLSNLEQLLGEISKCKPTVSVIAGNINARFLSRWSEDINTSERRKLYSLTSSYGFLQLINEPACIQTTSSSCINFGFTDQRNLSVNSGAFTSKLSSSKSTY